MTVSPKRKRGPSDPMQPFAPRLNTSAFPSSGVGPIDVRSANTEPHSAPGALLAATAESGSESPRSRVASQFELLQINKSGYGLPVIDFGSGDTGAVATKKAKHNEEVFAHHPHALRNEDSRTPHMGELSPVPQPVQEIAETPQHISFASDAVQLTPPPPSSSPSVKLFLSTRRPNPKLHRRSPSPSVHSLATTSSSTAAAPVHLPDQAALTWQNSEITGHEIDRERDDDGYGINGIGFRPTHQVAQQRALKRRQQILEWRARQAREDRQKRSDRRRLGALAPERKIGETQKRVVRFA
ncbi:hypothetical protein MPH_06191 [Macrophomina phaseolina MS6]|uniref:Uncharacterized protein n=1 Tax=Macrophomina phaseolina (strain MS6) TaxID=1126212 RepID=K2SII4_MACPH|nr:hypothetical protein MPH_06191 [Macrophomina phaseolina MS6]